MLNAIQFLEDEARELRIMAMPDGNTAFEKKARELSDEYESAAEVLRKFYAGIESLIENGASYKPRVNVETTFGPVNSIKACICVTDFSVRARNNRR